MWDFLITSTLIIDLYSSIIEWGYCRDSCISDHLLYLSNISYLLSVIFHVKEMLISALEVKGYTKRQNPSHKRSLTRKERDKRCWTNLKGNKKHMSQNNNLIWYVCSFVYWLWLHGLLEKVLEKPSCMLVWLGIKHILLQTNEWI